LGSKLGKIIVVTSGKGGVGKTTSSAAIGAEMALYGKKTVIIDFDIGLRNLDLVMGCERRVIFDFINVINGDASLNQALIRDRRISNLYILAASQTKDKNALKQSSVEKVLAQLKKEFDYIVCDSPAGIEHGAFMSLYFADEAIIVTNPEISSVRDSDRVIGILNSKSQRAENNQEIKKHLLISRYDPQRVRKGDMLSINDIVDILAIPLIGVVPESSIVLKSSNQGVPITLDKSNSAVKTSYKKIVARMLGITEQKEKWTDKLMKSMGLVRDFVS